MNCIKRSRNGELPEGSLFYEGITNPRRTLESLRERGLLIRLEWEDAQTGYWYALRPKDSNG